MPFWDELINIYFVNLFDVLKTMIVRGVNNGARQKDYGELNFYVQVV